MCPVLIDQSCLDATLKLTGLSAAALLSNQHNGYSELPLYRGSHLTPTNLRHSQPNFCLTMRSLTKEWLSSHCNLSSYVDISWSREGDLQFI
jgi:hypothetical protein